MGKAGGANGTCKDLSVGQPVTSKEGRGAKQVEGSEGLSRVGVRGGKRGSAREAGEAVRTHSYRTCTL